MDAEWNWDRLRNHLLTKPPACVQGFNLTSAQPPACGAEHIGSSWQIACDCGGRQGAILGYSLKDYVHQYDGPIVFLSPLAFECSDCGKVTEILDTDLHGYHSEVAKLEGGVGSAKVRGEGPRSRFACPACGREQFMIEALFYYWACSSDIFWDDPPLPCQEFFNEFLLRGTCTNCGKVSPMTDFGKL
jgi:hypothetical protein